MTSSLKPLAWVSAWWVVALLVSSGLVASRVAWAQATDTDDDGVVDTEDNCPTDANAAQLDADADGIGDACDPDLDGDGVDNTIDNCVQDYNSDQQDGDGNGIGDACAGRFVPTSRYATGTCVPTSGGAAVPVTLSLFDDVVDGGLGVPGSVLRALGFATCALTICGFDDLRPESPIDEIGWRDDGDTRLAMLSPFDAATGCTTLLGFAGGFTNNACDKRYTDIKVSATDTVYPTIDRLESFFADLAAANPTLVKIVEIGRSIENRPIHAVKLSDNVGTSEDGEPKLLYVSDHHAREMITTTIVGTLVKQLVDRYRANDPEVRWLLDHKELFVVPLLNPDGYKLCRDDHRAGSTKLGWRKNAHDNDANGQIDDADGVDPNRNYSYQFSEGGAGASSGFKSRDDYRGFHSFSEAETSALRTFSNGAKLSCSLSWHSSGGNISWPFSYNALDTADDAIFKRLAEGMKGAQKDASNPDRSYELVHPFSSLADGEFNDWQYVGDDDKPDEGPRILSWTIEAFGTSDGNAQKEFNPDTAKKAAVVADNNAVLGRWLASACGPAVDSADAQGAVKNALTTDDDVFARATGLLTDGNKQVRLYVVKDKNPWRDGDALTDVGGATGFETVAVDKDGLVAASKVAEKLPAGKYDIVVDLNENGKYDLRIGGLPGDAVDGLVAAGFVVTPKGKPKGTIKLKDAVPTSRRKLTFSAKDSTFDPSVLGLDPAVAGASLVLLNPATGERSSRWEMPADATGVFWKRTGSGFKYADRSLLHGPIAKAVVKRRGIKIVAVGAGVDFPLLGQAPQGSVQAAFAVGDDTRCTTFPGTNGAVKTDDPVRGVYSAIATEVLFTCPAP